MKSYCTSGLILILTGLLMPRCTAQQSWSDIDLHQISQEKVRSLVAARQKENDTGWYGLEPSCRPGQELEGYRIIESGYKVRSDAKQVWDYYTHTSPAMSWNGKRVSFGFLISKYSNTILYRNDDHYAGLDTGQAVFVNLRMIKGLYNLAVGFEIIRIDPEKHAITFSYLKGGKSSGFQTICFVSTKNGNTRISHRTAYRSNSFLRDHLFYPHFHRILINEFHRNMRNIIRQEMKK